MTKSDNLEDAYLSLYLANGDSATSNVLIDDNQAAAGSTPGSTNLYLNLHTNGIAEDVSNLNEITSLVGYTDYTNLAITRDTNNWDRLSAGLWANGNTANFTFEVVGAGGGPHVVTHWSLSHSNGNIGYSGPLSDSDPQPFTVNDSDAPNVVQAIAHGHVSNDAVILLALPNVTFPSTLPSNTLVYAINDSNDGLQVSLTSGGAAVNMGSGAGLIAGMNQQTLAENNTPRFVTNALRITED